MDGIARACGPVPLPDQRRWALEHFGSADLGHDRRLTARLLDIAARTLAAPAHSPPRLCPDRAALAGFYRFMSNRVVNPHALQQPHRQRTRALCRLAGRVLILQDTTELDHTAHARRTRGLGRIGNGGGLGLFQHSALAVTTTGAVLGLLHQRWWARGPKLQGLTRRQRQARRTESDVWAHTCRAIGPVEGCVLVQVWDAGGDFFPALAAAREMGHEFLVRACRDRRVNAQEDGIGQRLWSFLDQQEIRGRTRVHLHAHRPGGKGKATKARDVELWVRLAPVRLEPAAELDPRQKGMKPIDAWVILAREEGAVPAGHEAVEWVLLSSEPVRTLEEAIGRTGEYAQRWVIEEFHRVEKEGCGLEDSQLDDAADLERLAALKAVVAVELLRLRDLADPAHPRAQDPAALREEVPWAMLEVVGLWLGVAAGTLTAPVFLEAVARRGGWLGRKSDPRPGWKVLHRGWEDLERITEGFLLIRGPASGDNPV
jgi:hypothetical protein